MHATFRAFRRPSPDELEGIWEDGIVVLDTSTLVDIFRYGPRTKHQLLELLSHLEDQLWLPYQVGLEFYTGLEDLKDANRRFFDTLETVIVEAESALRKAPTGRGRLQVGTTAGHLVPQTHEALENTRERIRSRRDAFESDLSAAECACSAISRIEHLYEGKVGEPLSERELSDLRLRSDLGDVPLVQSKQSTASPHAQERYRDLVLWKEILDLGHRERRPILFVTGRTGVDWWSAGHGHTRTARPELVEEYYDVAGERVHICSVAEFLAVARVRTPVEIDEESILEAQSLSESDVMLGSEQQCRRIEALETRAVLHALRRALAGSESTDPMISSAVDRALERVLVLLASS